MRDARINDPSDFAKVRLSAYVPGGFSRGKPAGVELAWMIVSALFFRHGLAFGNRFKASLLRLFGAKVGKGVVIKPGVQIKFPWKLQLGSHSWIGENVWIDNLDTVVIESNVCLSQGCMLLCGNHDYTKQTFDLTARSITIEEGAWVGSRAIVGPGVRVGSHAVLTVGSIASRDLGQYTINRGNPAIPEKVRMIEG